MEEALREYRQSTDYERANLSLCGDTIDDIGRLSFRHTHTLISVSSIDVPSMSGHALTRPEKLLAFVHTHKTYSIFFFAPSPLCSMIPWRH